MFEKLGDVLSLGGGGTAVGLSIGTSSIKMVELKRAGKGWRLLHFGMIQLPEDAIVNREIMNHIAVVESIKTLSGQLKLKSKQVCTALSGTGVLIKRMSVQVQNMKELQDQVFWEAEQYLPFDVSEVVMDYHVISKTKDNAVDLILVAAKKSVVETYLGSIEDAGLKPKVVDVDFFALQSVFETNYPVNPSEAVAIVDIGASSLKMVVVHNGIPVFTKDAGIGGKNITQEIQRHLSLSYADAEALKMGTQGQGMPQEVSDLMHVMSENFASEIKRGLDFYEASSTGAPVSYVLLTGGSSKVPRLPQVVEEAIALPTQILNPFNSVQYDPGVFSQEYLAAIGPMAAIPVGLAIRQGAK